MCVLSVKHQEAFAHSTLRAAVWHPRRVRSLILAGDLKATKIGKVWIIDTKDLAALQRRKPGRPRKKTHPKTSKLGGWPGQSVGDAPGRSALRAAGSSLRVFALLRRRPPDPDRLIPRASPINGWQGCQGSGSLGRFSVFVSPGCVKNPLNHRFCVHQPPLARTTSTLPKSRWHS